MNDNHMNFTFSILEPNSQIRHVCSGLGLKPTPSIIIMLTSSDNSEDIARAKGWDFVSDFVTKPLTKEKMNAVSNKYFIEEIRNP